MAVKIKKLEITVDNLEEFDEVISVINNKKGVRQDVKQRVAELNKIKLKEDLFSGRTR